MAWLVAGKLAVAWLMPTGGLTGAEARPVLAGLASLLMGTGVDSVMRTIDFGINRDLGVEASAV